MDDLNSFWRVTAPQRAPEAALDHDIQTDVAVIGAGFTGLRAALELAERGSSVVVLEAQHVGHGASGRSGGQVNPMLPVAQSEDLRKAVGDVFFYPHGADRAGVGGCAV